MDQAWGCLLTHVHKYSIDVLWNISMGQGVFKDRLYLCNSFPNCHFLQYSFAKLYKNITHIFNWRLLLVISKTTFIQGSQNSPVVPRRHTCLVTDISQVNISCVRRVFPKETNVLLNCVHIMHKFQVKEEKKMYK